MKASRALYCAFGFMASTAMWLPNREPTVAVGLVAAVILIAAMIFDYNDA